MFDGTLGGTIVALLVRVSFPSREVRMIQQRSSRNPVTVPAVDPARAVIGARALADTPAPLRGPAATVDASDGIEDSIDADVDGMTRSEPPPLRVPRRSPVLGALFAGASAICVLGAALLFASGSTEQAGARAAAALSTVAPSVGGRAHSGTGEPRLLTVGLTKKLSAKPRATPARAAEPAAPQIKPRAAARPSAKSSPKVAAKKPKPAKKSHQPPRAKKPARR